MTLESALGSAYATAVIKGQPANARVGLKAALDADADLKAEANQFLKANSNSQVLQRCFITKTRVDLLKAALA